MNFCNTLSSHPAQISVCTRSTAVVNDRNVLFLSHFLTMPLLSTLRLHCAFPFIASSNRHSPALPTERDQHGNLNNIAVVKANVPEYDSNVQPYPEAVPNSPVESYDFSILPQEDHTTEPPMLPRLLASAPLDRVADEACHGTDFVRFNHMFSTNSDGTYGPHEVGTLASETRYKSKVITTILVTSTNKAQDQLAVPIQQPYRPNRTQPISIGNQPMGESQSLIMDALNNV